VEGDGAGSVLRRFPDFRRLFVGNSVSLLGSSVTAVALPLTAVTYLHASPAQLGLVGAVALLPHLVLGLPAGVWVGRLPYRRVLVTADLAQLVLVGAVPVLALCGVLRIWQLYVVVTLAAMDGQLQNVVLVLFLVRAVGLPAGWVGGPLPVALGVLAVAQLLRGAGPPLFGVNQQTFRQVLVAPGMVARVNATWRFVMLLGVASALASPLRTMRTLPAPVSPDAPVDRAAAEEGPADAA
jgi:hypothetical protein